jgi:hypothetical protein
MTGGRPREANDPSVMASVEEATTSVPHASLVGVIWRWRGELSALAVVAAVATIVVIRLGPAYLAVLASITAALVVCSLRWPPSRRWIVARAWCMITPHRVRTGCLHAWIQTRSGRLPAVLWTRPAPYGERVLLWCRAGITARDLEAGREVLAAACWATDVRVYVHSRRSHLVTLAVIRHSPERPGAMPPPPWPSGNVATGVAGEPPGRSGYFCS